MSARYLIRFDDICPTMNWSVWEQVETILNHYGIKPIVAIVPDNLDNELVIDSAKDDFWDRAKTWQNSGWTIALHGYQHIYSTKFSGLTKINNYSEFVGLSYEEQLEKLQLGMQILNANNINPKVWVAPGHSFDELTIKALSKLGINIISDGYYYRPVRRLGMVWVPQQLWRFRWMRWGLWTVCFHTNEFLVQEDVERFARDISKFASAIIPFDQALEEYPVKAYSLIDKLMERCWRAILSLKIALS